MKHLFRSNLGTRPARRLLVSSLIVVGVTILFGALSLTGRGRKQDTSSLQSTGSDPAAAARTRVAEAYGKLPMMFQANAGQTDPRVKFTARGAGYSLFLTPTESVFVMSRREKESKESRGRESDSEKASRATRPAEQAVLRMKLVGGNRNAEVKGDDKLAGKVNYFIGSDPTQWRTNVPTFSQVRYSDVYQGIDLVYYGNQRQLEYDFVVAPGRDARAIALEFAGAEKVAIEAETGDLLLHVGEATIRQHKPIAYQETANGRHEIEGRYAIKQAGQVGFEVGEYDTSAPLIIDPVLLYSTYLGGSGDEIGYDIALDSTGSMYVAGSTTSTNFPTAGAFQSTAPGGLDAFITKLNASGSALVYSTYLGGSGGDAALAIAVDSGGNAYVTGVTSSTTFPTANALQGTSGGLSDAFVTKLNAAGSALVYSTYLGGSGNESGFGIAVDSAGNAYVTGPTQSFNFPTANALQGTKGDSSTSNNDVFLTKLNAGGSALVYSTYLGGSSDEKPGNIAVDSAGSAYIAGVTFSNNFPTANALQGTIKGSLDAFVTKVNAAGSALVYSTYLGGTVTDQANSIKVDSAGNAYVTGATNSDDFPTANALQGTKGRFNDVFVTKLNATGSALVYSTFVGGSDDEYGFGIALDSTGNAYVTGSTKSSDFPTTNAFQGTKAGAQDTYVMKLNAAGSALVYSSYLGGAGFDEGHKIAVDGSGNAYVTGTTVSTNFPTANPLQSTNGGSADAFVSKIGDIPVPGKLLNIATRLRVQSGENVLIGGFIITGSDPKKIIIRGIGPSLAQFLSGTLSDPTLELFQGNTSLASNNDWKESQAEIEATGIPPTNDKESAIVRTLAPGNYTAVLRGNAGSTGIGVVEVYDLDQNTDSKLANIASRGFVDTDNNVMIGGLIVGPTGGATTTVVVRAIGPSLSNFGIAGALQDPTLDLVDVNGVTLRANDNWKDSQQTEIEILNLQPSDVRESALIETLAPGNYTAVVRGAGNTTGVGLVEVYNVQ